MGPLTKRVSRLRKLKVAYIFLCLCLEGITDVSSATKTSSRTVLKNGQTLSDVKNVKNNTSEGPNIKDSSDTSSLKRNSRQTPFISAEEDKVFEYERELPSFLKSVNVLPNPRSTYLGEGKRSKQSSIIPFPRLGRKSAFDPNLIMPYPDSWIEPYLPKSQYKSEELFSINDTHFEDMPMNYEYMSEDSKEDIVEDEESLISENSSQSSETDDENNHSDYELVKSLRKRQVDDNGTIIPYPRLGREEERELQSNIYMNGNHIVRKKRNSDFIIPQIRYGRSMLPEKTVKAPKQPYFIVPNFRPGRSSNVPLKLLKVDAVSNQRLLPYPRPGRAENKRQGYIVPLPRFGRSTDEKIRMGILTHINPPIPQELREAMAKSEESFVIPYPRPGKRFFGTKPLPPNVILESKDKDQSYPQENKEKEQTLVTFVLPYPRPGRSDTKSNGNTFLIPYARPGRFAPNSMLPYPRPGRSSNTGNQYYILPYPRSGRSQRTDFLLPYPRLGRSTPLSDNDSSRVKKYSSHSILPYPRLGRSESQYSPQTRLSNANKSIFVLPYPRLGRSTSSSLIPQFRVGKSTQRDGSHEEFGSLYFDDSKQVDNQAVNENEEKSFYDHVSEALEKNKLKSAVLVPAKKLHKHMLTGESHYMLPYPRPGRFV